MLLAGGGSTIFGVAFVIAATRDEPKLKMLALYAATGGADFLIQAWLLARRGHHTATLAA